MAAPALVAFRSIRPRFFEGLAPAEIKLITSGATQRRYLANSVVVNQGHPANEIFMLTSGRARFFYVTPNGRKVILLWIAPGDVFGGAAMLANACEYLLSTEAVKPSTVLVWDRTTMRELVVRHPRLADNALLLLYDYLFAYRAAHLSLICNSARERLAHVLVQLATGLGHKVAGGVELDVRNDELANEANITPYTASRLLRDWQRQGIIRKTRGKILVRAPERLFVGKL